MTTSRTRTWVGATLRRWADRVDQHGAPKAVGWSFTIEHQEGLRFRDDGRGCRLWYLGDDAYELAHQQADTRHLRVDWRGGFASWVGPRTDDDMARRNDFDTGPDFGVPTPFVEAPDDEGWARREDRRMSDGTMAVPMDLIATADGRLSRALCPACVGGRLHPYKVEVPLGGFDGQRCGTGWVAICAGASEEYGESEFLDKPVKPCGFSTPLKPVPTW